jgi:hypothetical protein
VDAHRVLVVTVLHFELAVVGPFERLTDPLRQVDIGGRDVHPPGIFVKLHDPVESVLFALVLCFVSDEVEKLGLVRMDKGAFQRYLTCGKLVADTLAGWTERNLAGLRRTCPLPTATMEYRPTRATPRWLGILSRNLVRIVPFGVENAVTVPGDASRWGLRCRRRGSSCHLCNS